MPHAGLPPSVAGCSARHAARTAGRVAPVVMLVMLAMLPGAGCDTLGSDVNDLLSGFDSTSPGEAARMMADPYNADNRREGTVLISTATFGGVETYLALYRDMVDNERDPIVKATAIRALGRHGAPQDVARILPHMVHDNLQVRWEAAKALQRLHNPMAIGDLLRVANDPAEHSDVRIAACVALGQYPQDRVFQGLVAGLDTRELAINRAAEISLMQITGQRLGDDPAHWLAWYDALPPGDDAFAARGEYRFPTYFRDDALWEKLAFWTRRNFEQPAQPAGLRPASEQSTYGEAPVPASTQGNGT